MDTTTPDIEAPALRGNVVLHGNDALLFLRIVEALNAKHQKTHTNTDILREAVRCLGKQLQLTV